MSYIIV